MFRLKDMIVRFDYMYLLLLYYLNSEQNLVNSEVKSNVHRMKGSSMRYTCVGYSL